MYKYQSFLDSFANQFKQKSVPDYVEDGTDASEQQLKTFKAEMQHMNINMIDFYANGKDWLEQNQEREKGNKFQAFNNVYQRRLLIMCLMPLQRGVSSSNVMQSVGMVIGITLANKEFREDLHKLYAQYKLQRAGGINEYVNALKTDPKMVKSIDEHLAKSNGGRVPFTEQSAAAMNLILAKQAYTQFREGKKKPELIRSEYANARDVLYKLADKDGITGEKLDRATKIMYRQLSQDDMSWHSLFSEIAYNKVKQSEFKTDEYVFKTADGRSKIKTRQVWDGNFDNISTNDKFTGMFTVREPLTKQNFHDLLKTNVQEYFDNVKPENFAKAANSIILGSMQILGYNNISKMAIEKEGCLDFMNSIANQIGYGMADGVNLQGAFKNIRDAMAYYHKTHDQTKLGLIDNCYTVLEEVTNNYATKGPEYTKAVDAWQEKIKTHDFEFLKNMPFTWQKRREAHCDFDYSNEHNFNMEF